MAGHRDDGTFHEDKAHHPGRKVSKGSVADFLIRNSGAAAPRAPWSPEANTVLGDTEEEVSGRYIYDTPERAKVDDWESMVADDFNIEGNAGNMYDEAYGPSDMTRRPAVGEWDNEDVFMTPEKKQCSCKGSGSCSGCK